MEKKHIVSISMETKKNNVIETNWIIRPWVEPPYIKGHSVQGSDWTLGNNVNRSLEFCSTFYASLLSSDIHLEKMKEDRTDYAGFMNYETKTKNPGIVLRGRDLGELSFEMEVFKRDGEYEVRIRRFSCEGLTSKEYNFVYDYCAETLKNYVKKHLKEFREAAIIETEKRFSDELRAYTERYTYLEKKSQELLAELKKI